MTQVERETRQGELYLAVSKLRHYAAELYSERTWNVNKLQQSLDLLRDFEKVIALNGSQTAPTSSTAKPERKDNE